MSNRYTLNVFLPFAMLLLGGGLTFWLWIGSHQTLQANLQRQLNASASLHAGLLTDELETLEGSLRRMARRWSDMGGSPLDLWRDDARARMAAFSGVVGVERLDANMHLRWSIDETSETFDVDDPADLTPAERDRLAVSRAPEALTVGSVRISPNGGAIIGLYIPLHVNGAFDGFEVLRVDLRELFAALLQKTASGNHLTLSHGGAPVAVFGASAASNDVEGRASSVIGGLNLEVRALPTEAFLRANGASLPDAMLAVSTVITMLVAFLAYLAGQLSLRAGDLRDSHSRAAEQERRYRELLRRADLGFVVTDMQGHVLEANEPSLRMAGCSTLEEYVGHSVDEFLSAEASAARGGLIAQAMGASSAIHSEIALKQPGGEEVLLSSSLIVDHTTDGFARVITLSQDITEKARIQREVAESRRIYEEVFENADVAIVDVNMSGLFGRLQDLRHEGVANLLTWLDEQPERLEELCRSLKINNMNRAGLRLFGVESVAYLQQIDYFLQSGRPAQVREFALGMWDQLPGIRREVAYTTFAGRDIAIIYSLRLPKSVGESRRVPIVVLDVTDVRSAETAKQASVAKSQFLASMSHEIRTPLNGVIGNLELLAQTDLRNDQEELLFDAEKAAKSLLALIGNILDFSKIEAGKLTIESAELNPAAIVQEAIDIVQSRARQKGIYVTGFIGPDVPEIVKGDATRIRQILLNLLGNSVKFTSHGGVHINLKVKDWDDSICQLLFTVHDSGRGFDQSHAKELFEPFTQDYKRATEDFGGTGLGLSICKSLVDTFGGEIDCESVRGHGASFWFTIPVQVVRLAMPTSPPDLSGRSVLFVNTNAEGPPKELSDYLVSRGAVILTAPDEDAALSISRKALAGGRHIDLAIYITTRMQWPNSSFGDALRESATVPMFYASDSLPETWRKALRGGASYLLANNIDPAFFDRNIHQAFGGLAGSERVAARESAAATYDTSLLVGKHALVLEDRLVNQTIIQRQLKKLSMTCTLAGDGIAGLDRLAQGTYDVILCDCSMPEMNGYEFTRILRQREAERGDGARLPVIAMTANAFREDREKCFDAGMDDFVSKPVTMHRLATVLSDWIGKSGAGPATDGSALPHLLRPAAEEPRISDAVDIGMLQTLIGSDDRKVIAEIMLEFLAAATDSWREVQSSAAKRDPVEIGKAAHGAKGEARNVGAVALGNLYEALETNARERNLADIDAVLEAIPAELRRVQIFAQEVAARSAAE